jgi:hypothetical protein
VFRQYGVRCIVYGLWFGICEFSCEVWDSECYVIRGSWVEVEVYVLLLASQECFGFKRLWCKVQIYTVQGFGFIVPGVSYLRRECSRCLLGNRGCL